MLPIEAGTAGGSASFPVEHLMAGICCRSVNWGISELDWTILMTQIAYRTVVMRFEASEMMLNCTASSETGAFLGQSEEGLASKVCQFHWSFQPPVVPRGISPSTKFHSPFIDEKEKAPPENNLCDILVKITSNVLMNKKLSQLSVFGRIRIPASSMIPRRKKGCSE
ncbi:uncharacterized protein LOC133211129 isoform X8 [Neopsephotus bourkii]|uniref:uncharacterized protein LOC133211129 isoform X8 n=1 Tax=Neopsephotus bourkii TaxID=309878 RepID=UPI002AA4FC89|nr:uncharacterized protein LOC133211129 isoform X8 [Neopsephotus bourkii]XP_061207269.1 uncharacterized protein LOC133211129 isoform X8 [Neopsephotus bourkii]XP_061207270.1 uncharacterized protein LOC133211129 isoform X8 [Neopsephotus bourkii]XP_061207271.1 uncharacterized protein LOC133211129 isoform X8 [Neopsephotus bourkii]